MTLIITIIIGGIVGLIYGSTISEDRRWNGIVSFVVGALGGVLGVWFFAGVLGLVAISAATNTFLGILWTILGALILLGVVNAISYSTYRSREVRRSNRPTRTTTRGYAKEYEEEEEVHTTTKKTKKK